MKNDSSAIQDLVNLLSQSQKMNRKLTKKHTYKVPVVWTTRYAQELEKSVSGECDEGFLHGQHEDIVCDFFDFHIENLLFLKTNRIDWLPNVRNEQKFRIDKSNLKRSNCYNMHIRYTTAYNHGLGNQLYNNQGSLLKAISLLPYLSTIGFNHIHLLPITPIGRASRKGDQGSPYAIKNPQGVDPNLEEPALELSAAELLKFFVKICHEIGISISTEFIFRTASIDSDLALDNPDWFYWISTKTKNREGESVSDAKYGRPNYSQRNLKLINEKVQKEDFADTISPKEQYINMFKPTPSKVVRADGNIVGFLDKKNTVRIPHGFADWPPDDPQPEWSDVTYLKLYDHNEYNYMAYNTVRMYDQQLESNDYVNTSLWDYISDILPYWINEFGIDGALLDMAHALPDALMDKILRNVENSSPDFFLIGEFFGENDITNRYFDAIVGSICLSNNNAMVFNKVYTESLTMGSQLQILSAESHNTRRISSHQNKDYAIYVTILSSLLNGVYMVLNGTEVYDSRPMNTGLGFASQEIRETALADLSLFSTNQINWNNTPTMVRMLRDLINVRNKILDFNVKDYKVINNESPILEFEIRTELKTIVVIANPNQDDFVTDHSSNNDYYGWNYERMQSGYKLKQFGVVVFEKSS